MIEFADKFWLYLLPVAVVLLLLLFQIDRKGRRANIRRFASDHLVQDLLQSYSPLRKRLKNLLLLLAVAFLFLSLSRPQWGHTWTESRSRGIDIVFALDTSRSMLSQDIKPNRLIRAKLAIEDLVNRLEGDRIGLVAFSGSAFLQCPLTLDYDAFLQSLDAVDTNVISAGGTDLSAAIRESESAFSQENNFKIVVLITDGEDLEESGIAEARRAAGNGVTVYSVGIGTAEGSPIPVRTRTGGIEYVRDDNGEIVQSRLDESTLREIAEVTGGFYVPLGATGYGLDQVLEAGIGSIPEEEISSELQRTAIERFQWPLGIALFLLLLEPLVGTRRGWRLPSIRGGTLSALILAMALFGWPQKSPAQDSPDIPEAVEQTDGETVETPPEPAPESPFARTLSLDPLNPIAHFNRATELYEEGEYSLASKGFTEALRLFRDFTLQADTFYNLGNTHYQEGAESFAGQPPAQVTETATTVSGRNSQPMRQGLQILDTAKTQPPPQEQIKQAIASLEQRKTATSESIENLSTSMKAGSSVKNLWQRSINDYESALELADTHEDARHNLDFVKKQTAELSAQLALQERIQRDQKKQMEDIDTLIEELKKLLDEEEQDQDQQNQEQQQQEQQNQDSEANEQNQDEGQSSQDQQQQQSGEQQGENQDQSNSENPQESSSEENSSSEPEEQPGETGEEGSPTEPESENDAGEESPSDPESGEGEEDTPQAGEEEDSSGDKQDEGSSGPPEDQGEDADGPAEPIQLGEEQADEIAEELAAASGEEGEAGAETGEEVVIGVMSSEDAARLLDSLKNSERKLPFAGRGSEGSSNRDNRKNW